MENLKLAMLNIKSNFKNEKELKASFLISIIGMTINNMAFLFLWFYFGKTVGSLNGWDALDVFGLYGFTTISFGVFNTFFYGITKLPNYISSGNFDKYLLTPKSVLVKVATSSISTSAVGDTLFGIICFIIYAFNAKLTLLQLLFAFVFIITTTIVTFSFTLICMTVSFYLMDGYNVSTGLYGLFLSNSLYHGGTFTGVLRIIFTFVIPSLLVGSLAVENVKNISLSGLLFMICTAIFWLIVSVIFFNKSLKKYESNSLFGFGG